MPRVLTFVGILPAHVLARIFRVAVELAGPCAAVTAVPTRAIIVGRIAGAVSRVGDGRVVAREKGVVVVMPTGLRRRRATRRQREQCQV